MYSSIHPSTPPHEIAIALARVGNNGGKLFDVEAILQIELSLAEVCLHGAPIRHQIADKAPAVRSLCSKQQSLLAKIRESRSQSWNC